jgi:hypothetical protein
LFALTAQYAKAPVRLSRFDKNLAGNPGVEFDGSGFNLLPKN